MNKRILLTTVALLTTAVGVPLSCYAESLNADSPSDRQTISSAVQAQPQNVEKVGETQSRGESKAREAAIARIQPHESGDRQAVTLYVRNIPVLTFLGDKPTASDATKVGQTQSAENATADKPTQVATTGKLPSIEPTLANNAPIWQAAAIASRLNQMSLDGVDASKITVSWKDSGKSEVKTSERYEIAIDGKKLVAVDANTRLPEQNKKKLSDEALQATNRLRRLLGNAPPLKEVAGMPEPKRSQPAQNIAFAPVRSVLSGIASWYGPGFHGNRTANGEVYNQNALTAAHKTLPFGTRVRVTHTGTGRSIVVRINDRGPFVGSRVIDLSAAAARVLGMMGSGVAPVRVEVLGR